MKNAKRNVIVSAILTIALCFSLMIGGTYAWFTDSAKISVNKIVSGKLQVGLEMKDGENWVDANGKTLKFLRKQEDGTLVAAENILWEPGATYRLPELRVKNAGNVALKYAMVLSGATGDVKLLDVINFTAKVDGEVAKISSEGEIIYGEKVDVDSYGSEVALSATWVPTENDNDYADLTVENVAVTVYATQATGERDSDGPDYDGGANLPALNKDQLLKGLENGGELTLNNDIKTENAEDTAENRVIIAKPTVLNLGDNKIITPDNMGNNNTNFCALIVDADTTVNANANGGIDTGINGGYGINVRNGAKLTINGGYYYGGGTAVQVQKGELTINGGIFAVEAYADPSYGYNFLLNCIDAAYKDGTAKISVKGGTFVNFNPADNKAEGAGTNFVAEGYEVVAEAHGGDTWYKVCKVVSTVEDLKETLSNGGSCKLADNLTIDEVLAVTGGDVTIDATDKTVANTADLWNGDTGAWSLVSARETANVTVMGGNFKAKKDDCYAADVYDKTAKLVIKGGNFIGNVTAVYVFEGELVIEGGFFDIQQLNSNNVQDGYGVLINCYDANFKNGTAKVTITGGTFVNFNPADNKAEGAGTNFVPAGYHVESEDKGNGIVWYTVVKD